MGHLQDFERELRARLAQGITEELIRWLKERMLESYRNGRALVSAAGADGERAAKSLRRDYK